MMIKPTNKNNSKRIVSFAGTDETEETVSVHSIPCRSDMTEEDVNAMWYSTNELNIIKRSAIIIVKKMISSTLTERDREETRGLENKTLKGSKARKQNRFAALFAVLDEQDRQRMEGRSMDSNYIAKLYHQSSAHCQTKALLIAQLDARVIEDPRNTISLKDSTYAVQKVSRTAPSSSVSSQRPNISCMVSPRKSRSSRLLMSIVS